MSLKAMEWLRGAKKVSRRDLDDAISDGTQRCDGCGAAFRNGDVFMKEHIHIIGPMGADEWKDLDLCGTCALEVLEISRDLAGQGTEGPA